MLSYRFNDFELIPDTRRLLHCGTDVAIGIRVFEVVAYLMQKRHRAVGRDELLSAVWGRVDGGDATLAQAILKARRAFGDDGNAQNCIRTVARFGYQWVAPTSEACRDSALVSSPTSGADAPPSVARSGNDVGGTRTGASGECGLARHVEAIDADMAIVANAAPDFGDASTVSTSTRTRPRPGAGVAFTTDRPARTCR